MYYLNYILYLLLLVQNRASSVADSVAPEVATTGKAVAGAAPPAEEPTFFDQMLMFLPLMLAMMLVFIMLNRPRPGDEKSQGKGGAMDLKKNDKVVTAGGIVGTVVNLNEGADYTTLRVDDSAGTKMQFMTSSIVKKLNDEDKAKAK